MKMIKQIRLVILLSILALCFSPAAVMAMEDTPLRVTVDSVDVVFPDLQPFVSEKGWTMVPIRYPMEALGCQVQWLGETRQARITRGETTAIFTVDSPEYTVNGETRTMNVTPVVMQGRAMFPLRYAVEAFDGVADFEYYTNTVLIYSAKHRDDAPEIMFSYYPEDAADMDENELMCIAGEEPSFWIKLICTSNEKLNYWPQWNARGKIVGSFRTDLDFFPGQSVRKEAWYGPNSDYQVKPGEELHFDIWIKWKDDQGWQESLEYEDYVYTVPKY